MADIAQGRQPDITFEDHVSVYLRQFNDATFKELDEPFKVGAIANAVGYALNAINTHKAGSDRRNNLTGTYSVVEDINAVVNQYGIRVKLNDDSDVQKGFKVINKEGTRRYDFKEKQNAH